MRNSIFVSSTITNNKEANVLPFFYIICHCFQHKDKQHFQKIKRGRKM